MEPTPDYSSYTLEDLHDVARHINKQLYPERHQQVLEQIKIKEAEPRVKRVLTPGEKRKRSNILRIVAAVEIVAGVQGTATLLYLFIFDRSHPLIDHSLFGLVPLLSITAGVLLWKQHPNALQWSLWLQAAQIPILKTAYFSYFLWSGMVLTYRRGWLGSDGSPALIIGLNFLSIGLFWALVLQERKDPQFPMQPSSTAQQTGGGLESTLEHHD